MDTPAPPPEPAPITARVTVTGLESQLLRELAAVTGRSPEDLALEWVAGRVVLPADGHPPVEWGMFEGPADLDERSDAQLRDGFAR